MRSYQVTLPEFDNAGESLASVHGDFRRDLVETFGGFTAVNVSGSWRDARGGGIFEDTSVRYEVAADWSTPRAALLVDLVASYCVTARQLAIMVTDDTGESFLVEPVAETAPAYVDDESAWQRARRHKAEKRERQAARHAARFGKLALRALAS
jgi:hypothetical protein